MLAVLGAGLAITTIATTAHGRIIAANGVRVTVPSGWHRVRPAGDGIDPRTVLVVGTAGARTRPSPCQIASYRVPPRGAVVVIVRWRTPTSGGGKISPGRAPLRRLRTVRRPSFECFGGRGAAEQVTLGRHAYQVNVMVGDRAVGSRIAEALAVGRSFDVTH